VEDWRLLSSHHARFNPTQWHPRLTSNTVEFLGSSLKFCRIATGRAHLYYRKGPTGEWDTAAGQAIVEAAGGVALTLEGMQPLRYNQKESLINPNFIVAADPSQHWQNLLKP
jgi:3'(2'), 5'-bisphosphate nucleotidase